MRVIAGTARRLPLVAPEGLDCRPTQDRIKETLFNIIQMDVPGCVFADLCAGSGGIGIEALSRGAVRAYFVENSQSAVKCIQENIHKTKFEDRSVVLKQDVLSALRAIHEKKVDIVFLDPPYASPVQRRTLEELSRMPWVTEDTMIIVEAALETDFGYTEELGFAVTREKRYKTQKHVFIRRADQSSFREE